MFAKHKPSPSDVGKTATLNRESRTADMDSAYQNPDKDPRGPWKSGDYTCNKTADERPNLYYPIRHPISNEEVWPKRSRVWAYSREQHEKHVEEGRLWWGVDCRNSVPAYKRFLTEVSGVVAQTIWTWADSGHTDEAKKEVLALFGHEVRPFETPKPIRLLRRIIGLGTSANDHDIVLDFFAGTGTAGHAVWAQNNEDGGDRRFILVQLPSPTGDERVPTLAEYTKERLRRAAAEMRNAGEGSSIDLGFRVFALDTSNIRAWSASHISLTQELLSSIEHLEPGRDEMDVLYELLVKLGLDLCGSVESRTVAGKQVYAVGGGVLIACLHSSIQRDEVEALANGIVAWHGALDPAGDTTCIFRDSAFADDVAKTNMAAILEQHGIVNVRSL